MRRFSRPKCLIGLIVLCFLCLMLFGFKFISDSEVISIVLKSPNSDVEFANKEHNSSSISYKRIQDNIAGVENPIPVLSSPSHKNEMNYPTSNYDVHLFYYPWYGSPNIDGKYLHWNHRYLRHWQPKEAEKWPDGRHEPPNDIGANFYPRLGPYSSRDPIVLEDHMRQIKSTGAGLLAVSWYPVGEGDDEGENLDSVFSLILDHAAKYDLRVCVHIEPYKNRNARNIKDNIQYIINSYGNHTAFYRRPHHSTGRLLPLFYVYDSYLMQDEEWKTLLQRDGSNTVRNTELDGIFVGLLVERRHLLQLVSSGFDGFYTYFASSGFTFGSNIVNWKFLSESAQKHEMLFIPSVGPGYIDERVRPWNSMNTKSREDGKYYERSFEAAVNVLPPIISVTSFNEWHEGTQIEEAISKETKGFKYLDYSPHDSLYFLSLTRKWILKFRLRMNIIGQKTS